MDTGTCLGTLPNIVVVGAMKCSTTALHWYLDDHPDIAMSVPKEINFFFGPNWCRGAGWYATHFRTDMPGRGETSPGYTSPDHPEAAPNMAAVIPDAQLIYMVRDPVQRALSQYRHHRADGDERRAPEDALLDPGSQYISRGRYHERVVPFLAHYPPGQIMIVAQEDLHAHRRRTLREIFGRLGVDAGHWSPALERSWNVSAHTLPAPSSAVLEHLIAEFRDDAARLRELAGRDFSAWVV